MLLAWTTSAVDPHVSDLSLEELINIKVTSVSKKETNLENSPAAISVITQEEIRRSGAFNIAELLRMVPGLDVARIGASEWAVSSRGFNNQYGNKLLVLVDGRSVYTPSFSGVFWKMQDLMLEDLDRIEVIRGPGATLWGANAVNGVINIMTKSAKETQGFLGSLTYGTELQPLTSLRYGGQLGTNLYYRVYGQFLNHGSLQLSDGSEAHDDWDSTRAGMRLDWQPSAQDHFTLQGDYNNLSSEQIFNEPQLFPTVGIVTKHERNHNYSGNVLGRWRHTFDNGSESSVQIYYDKFKFANAGSVERRDTLDLDLQHRFSIGSRNEVIWGLGYRHTEDNITSSDALIWSPQHVHLQLFNAYLQDEIKLIPDKLHLTLGVKLEHNDYTGLEIQPNGRLLWNPTPKQTFWGSVSRAVRTPNRFERGTRVNTVAFQPPSGPPALVALFPTLDLKSEEVTAYELGYRVQPAERLTLDFAGFYNTYENLHGFVNGPVQFEGAPSPPHVLIPQLGVYNRAGYTFGLEVQSQWQVSDSWRLAAGYTWLHMSLETDPTTEKDSPTHQFNLRSYLDITKNLELNGALYFVNQTTHQPGQIAFTTPSYVRLDIGATWRFTKNLELSVWGQNLLEGRHTEFSSYHTSYITEIPRSMFVKVTWRF